MNYLEQIRKYYFKRGGPVETPLFLCAIVIFCFLLLFALLTLIINKTLAQYIAVTGLVICLYFIATHILLFIVGTIYRHGIVKPILHMILIIVGMVSILIGLIIAAVGWIVPLWITHSLYVEYTSNYLQTWLDPVLFVLSIIFVMVWYAICIKKVESV